jgi:predicted DsbA family dithiol-disulfide isomerase
VRIELLRKNYEVEIRWRAFPLHPEIPEDGISIKELFAGRNLNIEDLMIRLKMAADEVGLPFCMKEMLYNTRLAHELGKWAEEMGRGDQFHNATFHAFFQEGKNIGKVSELIAIAESIGLSGSDAKRVLETRKFEDAVDRDWSSSYEMGITAVPTFIIDQRVVVGAQPYEILEKLMKLSNVKRR